MDLGDVAQHAAGADRGELLVVADQAHRPAAVHDVLDRFREVTGSGHPGLVDDDEGVRADRGDPLRDGDAGLQGVDELREGVGAGADLLPQYGCRGGGWGQPDDRAVVAGPRTGQHPHRGGLAGACGGQRELDAGPEVASSRTSCTCPGLSSTPLAVDSSSAMSIVSAPIRRPSFRAAAATIACSAATISRDV